MLMCTNCSGFIPHKNFCPLREPGPYLPENCDFTALSLFDKTVTDWLITCTLAYAESNKSSKAKRYALFMKREFPKQNLCLFWELCYCLEYTQLEITAMKGLHGVTMQKAQVLIRLHH